MKRKILLIEDDLFIRELYKQVLFETGYDILCAIDGEEGLKFASSKPDLILLDIMLPKLNGIDVLKKLKANRETMEIPVVLLTNLAQESIIKEAFEIGASGYLMKMKIEPYEIQNYINKFLDNPKFKMDIKMLTFD